MSPAIQLIVGLANPGKKYENTRHNAGAWFIDELLRETNSSLKLENKFHGHHGTIELANHTCHLLIPTTYMNLSGQAVSAVMKFYKIPPSAVLIAHDEIDLPAGCIKLKFDGGDGGHNGLKDVIAHLHTKQFHRLRIGVGKPTTSKEVVDYVLHPPSKTDKHAIDQAIENAQAILPLVLAGEFQKAMNKLHSEK